MEGHVGKRLRVSGVLCALALSASVALTGCTDIPIISDIIGGDTYKPELKSATVTPPTIGQSGTLRVGVNAEKSPLAGMSNDKIIGMDVDIAAAIADEMGLKLSIVDVGTDPRAALAEGKVDIVMDIDKAAETSEDMWTSQEYLPTGIALFALASSNPGAPAAGSAPLVAAQVSSTSAWAVTNGFGEGSLKATTNLSEAFTQLAGGAVQYVAADAVIGLYAAHVQDTEVVIAAMMAEPTSYRIGIVSTNTDLQNAVDGIVNSLDQGGFMKVVERKWLGQTLDLASVAKVQSAAPAASSTTEASS